MTGSRFRRGELAGTVTLLMLCFLVGCFAKKINRDKVSDSTYNIHGVALDTELKRLRKPRAKETGNKVNFWGYKGLRLSEKDGKIITLEGDELRLGEKLLFRVGQPAAVVKEHLGEPESIQKTPHWVRHHYPQHELRIQIQHDVVASVILQPLPKKVAEKGYKLCQYKLHAAVLALVRRSLEPNAKDGPKLFSMAQINDVASRHPCPVAGKPTIGASGPTEGGWYKISDLTLFCRGNHHSSEGVPRDYPQVHSKNGFVPIPGMKR